MTILNTEVNNTFPSKKALRGFDYRNDSAHGLSLSIILGAQGRRQGVY